MTAGFPRLCIHLYRISKKQILVLIFMFMGTRSLFSSVSAKGNNHCNFWFASLADIPFQKEQILFFKSSSCKRWEAKVKMAELLPHKYSQST